MLDFRPGDLLWCTDHLDVGMLLDLRNEEDGENPGTFYTLMDVALTCGIVVFSVNDGINNPDPDYLRARRRDGTWECLKDGEWEPIDFSESELCKEPPDMLDDPEEGPLPDLGPHENLEDYMVEEGSLSGEDG